MIQISRKKPNLAKYKKTYQRNPTNCSYKFAISIFDLNQTCKTVPANICSTFPQLVLFIFPLMALQWLRSC